MLVNWKTTFQHHACSFCDAFRRVDGETEQRVDALASLKPRIRFAAGPRVEVGITSLDILPNPPIKADVRRKPIGNSICGPGGEAILIAEPIIILIAAQTDGRDGLRAP